MSTDSSLDTTVSATAATAGTTTSAIAAQAAKALLQVRATCPLVHNITNYVTVNDVANAVLAMGASPIMADAIEEAADIASISSAVVLNMGTLNERTVASMVAAGQKANELGVPVIFDPVGAGASAFRNQTATSILNQVKIAIIRGNLSEVSFLAGLQSTTRGVDAAVEDQKNDAAIIAHTVARIFDCIVAITGATDTISDGTRLVRIDNGIPALSKVTGTGCMTSALVGAFAGAVYANVTTEGEKTSTAMREELFLAAIGGVAAMGIAGEAAYELTGQKGTGSFRIALIDTLSIMGQELFLSYAKIEEQ